MAYTKVFLNREPERVFENLCAAAITPGHLVETYDATTEKIRFHSTAGGTALKAFALAQILEGNEVTDAYSSGDRVPWAVALSGDEIAAILANGETVHFGTKVESAGDGTLRAVDADVSAGDVKVASVIGIAREELTASGATRFKIMVL